MGNAILMYGRAHGAGGGVGWGLELPCPWTSMGLGKGVTYSRPGSKAVEEITDEFHKSQMFSKIV